MVHEAMRTDFGRAEIYEALNVEMWSLHLKVEGLWKKTKVQSGVTVEVLGIFSNALKWERNKGFLSCVPMFYIHPSISASLSD